MSKREAEVLTSAMKAHAENTENLKRDIEKSAEQQQRDKEIAIGEIYEMAGKIKATNFFASQAEFFNLVMLKKVKDAKEYRSRFGISWEQFCEHVGVNKRTMDRALGDIAPIRQDFLDTLSNFSGVTFSKIKYLGMAVDEKLVNLSKNAITYNGETIPVDQEHAEEIQALIETLEETHKKEKDETTAALRTKERLLKDKENTINKMEKEIMRLERTVEKSELTEEEQEGVDMLIQLQKDFLTAISDIKKKIQPNKAPNVVLRQLYFLYIFISKVAMEERMDLNEAYKDADEVPWEISEMELPPTDVMIDNLPMTAGKGMGKKVVAKMEERKAKKSKK